MSTTNAISSYASPFNISNSLVRNGSLKLHIFSYMCFESIENISKHSF